MSKLALRSLVLGAVIALLGVASYAIAGGGTRNFNGDPMVGYEENPDISTVATGEFRQGSRTTATRFGTSSPTPGSKEA